MVCNVNPLILCMLPACLPVCLPGNERCDRGAGWWMGWTLMGGANETGMSTCCLSKQDIRKAESGRESVANV